MANEPLSSRFPGVLFSSGFAPTRAMSFDSDGGTDGAYRLLELTKEDTDGTVLSRMRKEMRKSFSKCKKDCEGSTILGAIAIVACTRGPSHGQKDARTLCPFDYILGQLYSFEVLSCLSAFQFPIPGTKKRWLDENCERNPPIILPIITLDWSPDVEGMYRPHLTSAVVVPETGKVEMWDGGERDPPVIDDPNSILGITSNHTVGRRSPARLREGRATKGLSGATESQMRQLAQQGGGGKVRIYKTPAIRFAGTTPVSAQSKRAPQRAIKKGENASNSREVVVASGRRDDTLERAEHQTGESVVRVSTPRAALGGRETRSRSERIRIEEFSDAAVQSDPIAVSLPLVITRPSSPVFFEVKDTTEQFSAIENELRDSHREVKMLKNDLEMHKLAESAIAARLSLLEQDRRLSTRLVQDARPLLPLTRLAYSLFPLPRIIKDALVDQVERILLGLGYEDRVGKGPHVRIERMETSEDNIGKADEAPAALPRSIDRLILPHLRLSSPSSRAKFVSKRLSQRVTELSRRLRVTKDENVDLLVQLALAADGTEGAKDVVCSNCDSSSAWKISPSDCVFNATDL